MLKAAEYDQEMPQSHTNPQHPKEKKQNTDSHAKARTQ